VERLWLPALERHRPAARVRLAGFDAHRDDPLAYLKLDDEDYRWDHEKLLEVAARHAKGASSRPRRAATTSMRSGRCVVEHVGVLAAVSYCGCWRAVASFGVRPISAQFVAGRSVWMSAR
jgi:acetoin utilization deacetylase AcuC-like enzyme